MLTIVRNMGGRLGGLAASPAVARAGVQGAVALSSGPSISSRSWLVLKESPFRKPSVPLSDRKVSTPSQPAEPVAQAAPAKPPLEMRFKLKDGRDALVRRAEPGDGKGLWTFMKEAGLAIGVPSYSEHLCKTATDEHLWLARAPANDAFVALVGGRIVGISSFSPETHELSPPKDPAFLQNHGVDASDVCVGHMAVLHDMHGLGVGTALKKIQTMGAARAGYEGVVSDTYGEPVRAIVRKLGGVVQSGGASAWTLVRTDSVKDKSDLT